MRHGLPRKLRIAFILQAVMVSLAIVLGVYVISAVIKHSLMNTALQALGGVEEHRFLARPHAGEAVDDEVARLRGGDHRLRALLAGPLAYPMIVERRLPKGDALVMAEIAGLQGAKMASALMPLCHPLQLELVRVHCAPVPGRHAIRVWCECASEARTGVEMEALAGVNAALLTLYDLTKPVEPALEISPSRRGVPAA